MNHSGSNINLTVGASGIKMVTIDTGTMIGNHDMQGISFASGGEKVGAAITIIKKTMLFVSAGEKGRGQ